MSGSAIDNALVAKLAGDATLLGCCPHGVYWAVAPQGSTRFVVVSLVDAHDEPELGGTAYEENLYAVEARMRVTSGESAPIRDAADRIHALLQDQPLTVAGYACVSMHRDTEAAARIRITEFEAADPGLLWYRRGGYYRVLMTQAT